MAGTNTSSLMYGIKRLKQSVWIKRSMQTVSVNMTKQLLGSIWICCLTENSLSERISELTKEKRLITAVINAPDAVSTNA